MLDIVLRTYKPIDQQYAVFEGEKGRDKSCIKKYGNIFLSLIMDRNFEVYKVRLPIKLYKTKWRMPSVIYLQLIFQKQSRLLPMSQNIYLYTYS